MKQTTQAFNDEIVATPRTISARAKVYSGSTLLHTWTGDDSIQSMSIDATPVKGKFWGFGISQQLTLTVLDTWDQAGYSWEIYDLAIGQKIVAELGTESELMPFCDFFISSIERDEKSGLIKIIAYDPLATATMAISNITVTQPATVVVWATAIATYLGLAGREFINAVNATFNYTANFSGQETVRNVLDDIAEVTGTVYYIDASNKLTFKTSAAGDELTIDKDNYFEYSSDKPVQLTGIAHTNALENTVIYDPYHQFGEGYDAILYENIFLSDTTLTDAQVLTMLENLDRVVPTWMVPYSFDWRGNPALEISDTLRIQNKGDAQYTQYLYLDQHLSYDGGLRDTSAWEKGESEKLGTSPKSSISQAITVTEAKIDKANNEIILKVSKNDVINQINLSTEGIQINSNRINLQGYITATDVGATGTTVIDGGRIQTGTISAVAIDIGNGNFTVDQYGNLLCNDAIITGNATFNGAVVTSQDMTSNYATVTNMSADRVDVADGIYSGDVSISTGGGVIDTTRQITVTLNVTRHGQDTIALNFSLSQPLYHKQAFYVRLSYINTQGLNYYVDMTTEVPPNRSTWTSTYSVQDRLTTYFTVREFYPVNLLDGDSWSDPVLTQKHYSSVPNWNVTGALVPSSDNQYTLGTGLQRWSNINVASFNGAPMPTASGRYCLKVTASAGGVTYQWEAL